MYLFCVSWVFDQRPYTSALTLAFTARRNNGNPLLGNVWFGGDTDQRTIRLTSFSRTSPNLPPLRASASLHRFPRTWLQTLRAYPVFPQIGVYFSNLDLALISVGALSSKVLARARDTHTSGGWEQEECGGALGALDGVLTGEF